MSGYTDVSTIVDGAVYEELTFQDRDADDLKKYIDKQEELSAADGLHTQIFLLHHDHEESEEGCECAQYEVDGKPAHEWNVKDEDHGL